MEYTLWSIIAVQALLAFVLWSQNRQLNAQTMLVELAVQDLVDRGVIKIVTDEEDDDDY